MRKTILMVGVAICIICAAFIFGVFFAQRDAIHSQDLTLSDYPKVFAKEAVIVIGENASLIEIESAEAIAAKLENLTGSKPEVISSKTIESFKYTHNLIILGTPKTNPLLEEIYEMTDAIRVTEEDPGKSAGILEILRNPWNEEKAMLLVEGSDRKGIEFTTLKLLIEEEQIENLQKTFIETDLLNESWVKETIHGTSRELIFQEALCSPKIHVFIGFTHKPTVKEIQELEKLGVIVNLDKWRQAMTITSVGYCPAIIPTEHLNEVAQLDYVLQLTKW